MICSASFAFCGIFYILIKCMLILLFFFLIFFSILVWHILAPVIIYLLLIQTELSKLGEDTSAPAINLEYFKVFIENLELLLPNVRKKIEIVPRDLRRHMLALKKRDKMNTQHFIRLYLSFNSLNLTTGPMVSDQSNCPHERHS